MSFISTLFGGFKIENKGLVQSSTQATPHKAVVVPRVLPDGLRIDEMLAECYALRTILIRLRDTKSDDRNTRRLLMATEKLITFLNNVPTDYRNGLMFAHLYAIREVRQHVQGTDLVTKKEIYAIEVTVHYMKRSIY